MAVTTCMGQNVTSTIGNNLGSTCNCAGTCMQFS